MKSHRPEGHRSHADFSPPIKRAASSAAPFITFPFPYFIAFRQLSSPSCVPPSASSSSLRCASWRRDSNGDVLVSRDQNFPFGRAWNLLEQKLPAPIGPVQLPVPK